MRVELEAVEEGLVELAARLPVRKRVGALTIGGEVKRLVQGEPQLLGVAGREAEMVFGIGELGREFVLLFLE